MIVVLQRVKKASVTVENKVVGKIGPGFLLLVGVGAEDSEEDAVWLADKIAGLRVFNDEAGKMNLDIFHIGGQVLSVSQFTLYGSIRKGKRPSFTRAAPPEKGKQLFEYFNQLLRNKNLMVETGTFGAMMDVELINDGPVTLILDSNDRFKPRNSTD
ncbi:MAG: D-aminoacyl-tRNA deacylase [Calditrichia bacterium]